MIYAIVENSIVTNVVLADEPLNEEWIDVTEVTPRPSKEWTYDGAVFTPNATTPTFNLANLVITRNAGQAVPQNGNKYYLDVGDSVEVTGDIVNNSSVLQTAINAPVVKLPIVKHADDQPTTEEIYFSGAIVDGVLTVSGEFTLSGNYKALAARNNRALDRLPAGFHMTFDDVDFLV